MRQQLKVKDEALRALDERTLTIHILIDKIQRMNDHFLKERAKQEKSHEVGLDKLYTVIDQLRNNLRRVLFKESTDKRNATSPPLDMLGSVALDGEKRSQNMPSVDPAVSSHRITTSTRATTGRSLFGLHRGSLGAPKTPLKDLRSGRVGSVALLKKAPYLNLL